MLYMESVEMSFYQKSDGYKTNHIDIHHDACEAYQLCFNNYKHSCGNKIK